MTDLVRAAAVLEEARVLCDRTAQLLESARLQRQLRELSSNANSVYWALCVLQRRAEDDDDSGGSIRDAKHEAHGLRREARSLLSSISS